MRSLIGLVVALALVACAQDPVAAHKDPPRKALSRIDVAAATQGALAKGLSLDPSEAGAIDLMVDTRGIVRINTDGDVLLEHKLGERGLPAYPFNDVAAEGHDVFVLLADAEGYLWDPATESFTVHFCVEPGWEEPVVVQRNDALAVNDNLIIAAPRFYTMNDGTGELLLTESALRTYRAGDGEPLSSADLTETGAELTGIALAGDEIVGVQGHELLRFSLEGELLGTSDLEGIDDATGIAVDLAAGHMLVLDASDAEIRVFPL